MRAMGQNRPLLKEFFCMVGGFFRVGAKNKAKANQIGAKKRDLNDLCCETTRRRPQQKNWAFQFWLANAFFI